MLNAHGCRYHLFLLIRWPDIWDMSWFIFNIRLLNLLFMAEAGKQIPWTRLIWGFMKIYCTLAKPILLRVSSWSLLYFYFCWGWSSLVCIRPLLSFSVCLPHSFPFCSWVEISPWLLSYMESRNLFETEKTLKEQEHYVIKIYSRFKFWRMMIFRCISLGSMSNNFTWIGAQWTGIVTTIAMEMLRTGMVEAVVCVQR